MRYLILILTLASGSASANDPFEMTYHLSGSSMKAPLDTRTKRPLVATGEHCFANVWHRDAFWVGCYEHKSVERVIVMFENHLGRRPFFQVRFQFKEDQPLKLSFQAPRGPQGQTTTIRDLVISAEAVHKRGVGNGKFHKVGSWSDQYGFVLRALSLEERGKRMSSALFHTIEQFELPLNEPQRNRILFSTIEWSQRMALNEIYEEGWSDDFTFVATLTDLSESEEWTRTRPARFRKWFPGVASISYRHFLKSMGARILPDLQVELGMDAASPECFSHLEGASLPSPHDNY